MKKKKYGNIYEILLTSNNYMYVCHIEEVSFGVFNYKSNNQVNNIVDLLNFGFVTYKACKETAIRKKIWKLIGSIDLEKENIIWPDLASYAWWDIEGSIERSNITRNGSLVRVDNGYFLELVDKGLIGGVFDNHATFENWLDINFGRYLEANKYPPENLKNS